MTASTVTLDACGRCGRARLVAAVGPCMCHCQCADCHGPAIHSPVRVRRVLLCLACAERRLEALPRPRPDRWLKRTRSGRWMYAEPGARGAIPHVDALELALTTGIV